MAAIVTSLAVFPRPALAKFDLSFDAFARSFPLSGYADVQVGDGELLWGSSSSKIAYGYLRPYAEVDTAGTYNSGLVGLEFFPISFLGVRAGEEWIQNDMAYRDFRCDIYNCLGTQYRKFVEARLLLGAGPWFLQFVSQWDFWTQKHPEAGDTLDADSGLPAFAYGDTEVMLRGLTGFKIAGGWAAVGGMQYYQMTRDAGISRIWLAGPRFSKNDYSFTFGALYYDSTVQKAGGGAFAGFSWTPLPAIGLH